MTKRNYTMALILLILVLILIVIGGYFFFENKKDGDLNEERRYCSNISREGRFCTQEYAPVCGWVNSEIKCIKWPCAMTFSNGCFACLDEKVEYYTDGECPM